MEMDGKVTMTIHGLAEDNGLVRADVFLKKFDSLVKSLKIADVHLNGKKSHNVIIEGLAISSAKAAVREKVSVKNAAPTAGYMLVAEALTAVYNGDRHIERFPVELIKSFAPLAKVDGNFSHGEIDFPGDNIIRIDEYLQRQTERAIERVGGGIEEPEAHFQGISFGAFDGVLKELDSRGNLVKGRLILTAGGKELECIFNKDDIQVLRENFERRARVEGVAHYDGENLLPIRLDVRRISPINLEGDLARWRGVLKGRRIPKLGGL